MRTLNPDRCQKWVADPTSMAMRTYQCSRKSIKDGYCTIHHPDYIKAKREKERAKWDETARIRGIHNQIHNYEIAAKLADKEDLMEAKAIFIKRTEELYGKLEEEK